MAAHGVVFSGRVDPLGGIAFKISPLPNGVPPGNNDDLDDGLDKFAGE